MTFIRSLIVTFILVLKIHVSFSVFYNIDGYLRARRAQEAPWLRPYLYRNNLCLRCPSSHKHIVDSARVLRHRVDLNKLYRDIRSATQSAEFDVLRNQILNKPLHLSNQLYQLLNSLDSTEKDYINRLDFLRDVRQSRIHKPRKGILKRLMQKSIQSKMNDEVPTTLPSRRKARSTESDISSLPISSRTISSLPPATTKPVLFAEYNLTQTETLATTNIILMDDITESPDSPEVNVLRSIPETTPMVITRTARKQDLTRAISLDPLSTTAPISSNGYLKKIPLEQQKFGHALDQFERKYYNTTFGKLLSISPADRRENGISFVESGFFLYAILTALTMELDSETRSELEPVLIPEVPIMNKIKIMQYTLDNLPDSSNVLKLHWSTRLLVNGNWTPSTGTLDDLHIKLERLNGNETPEMLVKTLNHKVEEDSGGAMRNTFEEDELSDGARAVLLNTLYVRARWRAAPTLLNGTRLFRDAPGAPLRTARMIRVNDVMRYANLPEWDAEAIEISYATPGLSLLLLVPRGQSLRSVAEMASTVSLGAITERMYNLRIAATLPIYTLRMTLLLPNKLQAMGICRLVDTANATSPDQLRLSHAVQRLMFWAEAGRNAFKDDGIEWDDPPEKEMIVDRPYLFYVRWRNVTIMNGNFVL